MSRAKGLFWLQEAMVNKAYPTNTYMAGERIGPAGATPRIAILGAGPIGIEAALYARTLGYPVTLYEKGSVASNFRKWGHFRLFSPWSYNRSALGVRRLYEEGFDQAVHDSDVCPTGTELIDTYLAPLVRLPELRNALQENCEILACGKANVLKRDRSSEVDRGGQPFRLLVRDRDGRKRYDFADVVIDATGVFGEHNFLGDAGIPALGETEFESEIEYNPPDVTAGARERYAGCHTVVIGAGSSGATTAVALANMIEFDLGTRVSWVCKTENERPLRTIDNDPLPERRALSEAGNRLAAEPPAGFEFIGGHCVVGVEKRDGRFVLTLENGIGDQRNIVCDRVVANVGYHPNEKIYRQLHVHECYSSLGPIALAASLAEQGTVDCLAIEAGSVDLLRTPEPNFFILGAKSFGTNPAFLLHLGHEHIKQLFTIINEDAELDLYRR